MGATDRYLEGENQPPLVLWSSPPDCGKCVKSYTLNTQNVNLLIIIKPLHFHCAIYYKRYVLGDYQEQHSKTKMS